MRTVSATEARNRFGQVLRVVANSGGPIFVERDGKPVAVILSIHKYEHTRRPTLPRDKMHVPPAIAKIAPDGNLTPRQKRRFLIEMSLRKQKPGTGSSPEFQRRRTAVVSWPDLRPILEGIDWVIVGSVATRAYMPERTTKGLDILVNRGEGDAVIERLKAAGYTVESRLALPGYALRSLEGAEVDVLFGDAPWVATALKQPYHDAAGYPVLSLPYLVLMRLIATRTKDWADLSRMLGLVSEEELNEVRAVVTRYSPEDSGDLESLIYLGKLEVHTPLGQPTD
ncbi:MAG TPA: type II toxin-antitoxin system Phd/YefM family antitoxin [Anaerolineae bacterium]|nr:type II toxin-antitoxin system Phd/YefM family antitoxin [Anaerolineae bacterium]